MGMFDEVKDEHGVLWQTKAFENLLARYATGDKVPYPLQSFQFEIYGGRPMQDSLATVINQKITAINVERDQLLPLVGYHGDVHEQVPLEERRSGVPNLLVLREAIEAGAALSLEESRALLEHAQSAVIQRETMRLRLSESAGRNIDLHRKLASLPSALRWQIADEVEQWMSAESHNPARNESEIINFIREGDESDS